MPCDPCSLLFLGGAALVGMLLSDGKKYDPNDTDEEIDIAVLNLPEDYVQKALEGLEDDEPWTKYVNGDTNSDDIF